MSKVFPKYSTTTEPVPTITNPSSLSYTPRGVHRPLPHGRRSKPLSILNDPPKTRGVLSLQTWSWRFLGLCFRANSYIGRPGVNRLYYSSGVLNRYNYAVQYFHIIASNVICSALYRGPFGIHMVWPEFYFTTAI